MAHRHLDRNGPAPAVLDRSDTRILLVQIVHSQSVEAGADESVAALKSMIVYGSGGRAPSQ